MRYNQLGCSGLFVSEICLGTMTFGGSGELYRKLGSLQQPQVDEMVRTALAAGVNFIDTANVYSFGVSESLLGQALKNLGVNRSDVVIATKVYSGMGPLPNERGASRGHIMDSVRGSLDRLQTDHIDLYQIHGTDVITPLDETLRTLDDLVRCGMVRYVGVSNWQAWRIMKALGIADQRNFVRPDTVQAYYSIAGRDIEREIVPLLVEEKLGLLVWSPLAGGLLTGKYDPDAPAPRDGRRTRFDFPPTDKARTVACLAVMREIAQARNVSIARVALAWLLTRPHVTSVIIGATSLDQLSDNLAAARLILTKEETARLDEVSALPPEYPGWVIPLQSGHRRPPPFIPSPGNEGEK
jgi:aryl-alcohol dehydrogenase-like predicted oxidoreductase